MIGTPKPRSPRLVRYEQRLARDREAELQRSEIRVRDGHRCRHCQHYVKVGAVLLEQRAEVAHLVPRSLDPTRINDPSNQILLCGVCHAKIHAHELEFHGTDEASVQIVTVR